ncbi:MAG: peptidoglycan DD-metalloendopeptidase family protein [Candidatus Riflebacteria bacterium]|nr:peptidoglycan DD-metalloendopeptidase family protein [Candidatus Riflebacteria bacterium]
MKSTKTLLLIAVLALACSLAAWAATETIADEPVKTTHEVSTAPDAAVIAPEPPKGSAETPAAAKNKVYTVVAGDTLWDIAARFLGDPHKYPELVEANKAKYPSLANNPGLILPGWELTLPGVPDNSPSASNPVEGTVQVDTSLNVRSGPWGSIIGSLHQGDKVTIIGTSGDWYKISYNGQTAYVHANYVSTAAKPAGQTPVNQPGSSNDTPVTPGNGRFGGAPCSPMPGHSSSEFGPRDLFGHSFHNGIDLPVGNGTRLNSLGDGEVIAAGWESGGGNYVKIRYDNGIESFYCHLQSFSVRAGQRVSQGQEVARSDNTGQWTTGPHLHMGIKKNGSYVNPRSIPGIQLP